MVNYQQGKIYKIVTNTDDDICYVGSTTKKYLSQRMTKHVSCYKSWKNGKGSNISSYELFEKYGIENCRIELLESHPCNSKDELSKKEGHYITALNCVNKRIMGRTPEIYYEENKDKILEYGKKYRDENKDKILEYAKKYRDENKDIILEKAKTYGKKNRDKISKYQKIYYEENKEQFIEKAKLYRQEHKEEISEKEKEKYSCCCGSTIVKRTKSKHEKTKKHIDFITSQDIL